MRCLGAVRRQGFIVVFAGAFRVKTEVELIFPSKLKSRLAQRIVTVLGTGMPLGQVSRMRRNLVGDHALLHILAIRKAQMFLGRHITKHRRAVPTDHRGADPTGDVVIPRRDIRRQRSQRVKRRLMAPFKLLFHVLLDHVHRHVAGPLVHHLNTMLPGALCQIPLHF